MLNYILLAGAAANLLLLIILFNQWQKALAKNQQLQQMQNSNLSELRREMLEQLKSNRQELNESINQFQQHISANSVELRQIHNRNFDLMGRQQAELIKNTESKLEQMRQTVDEKLHKTLEKRLGESFQLVSKQLESVHKAMGEMQNLAQGVGDLKKVLTNVKTRGILGEIQLENILEQIMAPEQYDKNVITKPQGRDFVEFAIKLPGKTEQTEVVYLPIDAKFPQENYIRLQQAREIAHKDEIEKCTKSLITAIKKSANDIQQKYLAPPYTTDFGILFLPTEGLYAEIASHDDLIMQLQRDYKIIITGPTTLSAMLNSLQMGFKTLAIQKRSSEVWQILAAVKAEFNKFGGVLQKAQKKINEANHEIDTLVGTRTRMMLSKLRKIEELPNEEQQLLDD